MKRIIGGLAAGIVTLAVVQGGMELLAHQQAGSGAMLPIVAMGYFLSALAGGYLAARISGRNWAGWAIAALVAAGAVWSLLESSHPLWMQIASVAAPLLGGALAVRLAANRGTAAAAGDGR
jgi:regulator of RNase E activity RraA